MSVIRSPDKQAIKDARNALMVAALIGFRRLVFPFVGRFGVISTDFLAILSYTTQISRVASRCGITKEAGEHWLSFS